MKNLIDCCTRGWVDGFTHNVSDSSWGSSRKRLRRKSTRFATIHLSVIIIQLTVRTNKQTDIKKRFKTAVCLYNDREKNLWQIRYHSYVIWGHGACKSTDSKYWQISEVDKIYNPRLWINSQRASQHTSFFAKIFPNSQELATSLQSNNQFTLRLWSRDSDYHAMKMTGKITCKR